MPTTHDITLQKCHNTTLPCTTVLAASNPSTNEALYEVLEAGYIIHPIKLTKLSPPDGIDNDGDGIVDEPDEAEHEDVYEVTYEVIKLVHALEDWLQHYYPPGA